MARSVKGGKQTSLEFHGNRTFDPLSKRAKLWLRNPKLWRAYSMMAGTIIIKQFSFRGRLSAEGLRRRGVITALQFGLLVLIAAGLIVTKFSIWVLGLATIQFVWWLRATSAAFVRRLHDLNLSGLWLLGVPTLVAVAMLFSQVGWLRYGAPPVSFAALALVLIGNKMLFFDRREEKPNRFGGPSPF